MNSNISYSTAIHTLAVIVAEAIWSRKQGQNYGSNMPDVDLAPYAHGLAVVFDLEMVDVRNDLGNQVDTIQKKVNARMGKALKVQLAKDRARINGRLAVNA